MKLNITYMNGYPPTVRGIPAICLLVTKVNDWINENYTVPTTIEMSKEFHKKLESECKGPISEIETLVGTLTIIDKDMEEGEISVY
jgi:hypothetical protein